MKELSLLDRIFVWYARLVEKPVLWAVRSQKVLRFIFSTTAPLSNRLPKGWTAETDAAGNLNLTPPGPAPDGLLLYIHGGGFTIGAPKTHQGLAAHVAEAAGLRAQCLAYPLAPENPYPAAPDAVFAAYSALVAGGETPVAIGGDSAGGCLALLCVQRARDAGLPLPRAMVLIAPITDLSDDLEARFAAAPDEYLIPAAWARRIETDYLAGADPTDPAVSPLLGDLTGLPPTLVHAGAGETLAHDARALEQRLDDVTLDLWPGLPHVWHLKAGIAPAATRACAELGAFIKAHK